jgi:glyoxylase-like metal-dependent hydrolase (beta-lactamase superfamily II)
MKITPQIYMIHGMANQYLLIDKDELTLIDTGMPNNKKNVLNAIKSLGFEPANLKRILITHGDPDHLGAANSLREITDAQVFASKIEADAMNSGTASREIHPKRIMIFVNKLFGMLFPIKIVPVDRILEYGEVIPVLGGMLVLDSGGHCPGHISFFLPEERILFAGDSINDHHGKPAPNLSSLTSDKVAAQKTYEAEMNLNPLIICCGHAFFDLRG